MKLNVNYTFKNFDGTPIFDVDAKGQVFEATMKTALINALSVPDSTDTPVVKMHKFTLAQRVFNTNGHIELSDEDVKVIIDVSGKYLGQIAYGQICLLLAPVSG